MEKQIEMIETAEYKEFVNKFKPKKTTDDCYTPDNIYEVVKNWAINEYNLKGYRIMRPFYPGGDYENEDYNGNCVVIDNPPFSIISQIARFYNENHIKYFLFAPSLTLLGIAAGECNYISTHTQITYDNGAKVNTSFISNLGEWKIRTAPDLTENLKRADKENSKAKKNPKIIYPNNIWGVKDGILSTKGQDIRIKAEECQYIRGLDSQKPFNKSLFGAGFLVSDDVAQEITKAYERAEKVEKIEVWELSEREKEIIKRLNKQGHATQ